MRAAVLFERGMPPAEVARRLDVTPQTAGQWRKRWKRGGAEALRARPTPGRPSKLTNRQKSGLCRRLQKGALSQGFPTDLWTGRRVKELISRCYGVDYHVCHVDRLLHELGFSPSEARASRRRTR